MNDLYPLCYSYRTWLEQLRRERRSVLTITSLQLPECPVPLIDSQANKRCRTANNSREYDKEETLDEIFAKVAEARAHKIKSTVDENEKFTDDGDERVDGNCEIQPYHEEDGGSIEDQHENDDEQQESSTTLEANCCAAGEDCECAELARGLRVSIRERTDVDDRGSNGNPSSLHNGPPEITHTIRIAMRCPIVTSQGRLPRLRRRATLDSGSPGDAGVSECGCPGRALSVALDFSLDCGGVQLEARDAAVSIRPVTSMGTRHGSCVRRRRDATAALE
ncbi:hypothetical protein QAD02_019531 [Eretmocerus hayati]|uniref:Uncharacterized protein n=1 Tax=Eretmocerus hayati TaxID=131215 RepID=A0ACC2PJI6_9HYME|nr:hypothetical protein QAD02_019531 [Eretmocerus hayati]